MPRNKIELRNKNRIVMEANNFEAEVSGKQFDYFGFIWLNMSIKVDIPYAAPQEVKDILNSETILFDEDEYDITNVSFSSTTKASTCSVTICGTLEKKVRPSNKVRRFWY